MVIYKIFVFGTDRKSNMAARALSARNIWFVNTGSLSKELVLILIISKLLE
jgi:hypothetical protein